MTPAFTISDLTVRFGDRCAVRDISLTVPHQAITAIVGPNGCGKSTLLRAIARLQNPSAGTIHLDTEDITTIGRRAFAQRVALLPQNPQAPENLTVLDLVARGRDPYRRWFDQWSRPDEKIVHEAINSTGLAEFADRPLSTLSGGQRQRAWIALALAQRTNVLLLDEPTTYLDIAHQLDVLDTITNLQRLHDMTVVMVLHDLSLATRYADHIIALRDGQIMATGPAAATITPELLRRVFDVECSILTDPRTQRPIIVPHSTLTP